MAIDIENPGGSEAALDAALQARINFRVATVDLSAAQILALHTTPIVVVPAPGADYAVGDTGYIQYDGGNGSAFYTVNTVDGGGAVLTYTLTNDNYGFLPANGVPTNVSTPQAGIGTGFTIDITDTSEGDGTVRLTVGYRIIDLS